MANCIFCDIVAGNSPAKFIERWADVSAFVPLNPVVPGHVLVVPHVHVEDYTENPKITALTMRHAAMLAKWWPVPSNLITSKGKEATQSVFHLHVHLIPRHKDDGLALPWYSGKGNHV